MPLLLLPGGWVAAPLEGQAGGGEVTEEDVEAGSGATQSVRSRPLCRKGTYREGGREERMMDVMRNKGWQTRLN